MRAGYLQDGKLARFNDEDGSEHEPNAGSKHRQGCDQQPTKDEKSVPPTHCRYWLAKINMDDSRTRDASLLQPR